MLCFEVWKNGKKLTVAGVRESGVVSFMLRAGSAKEWARPPGPRLPGELFQRCIGESGELIHPILLETKM